MNPVYEELKELLTQTKELRNRIYEHCKELTEAILDGQITDQQKINETMGAVLDFSDEERFLKLDSSLSMYVFYNHPEMVGPCPNMLRLRFETELEDPNTETCENLDC